MDNEDFALFRDIAHRALKADISPYPEHWQAQHRVPSEL